MLQVDDVSVSYAGVPAVEDASFGLPTGEVLAVVGPSGCGKSTLLRAIAGLESLSAGRVIWDGVDQAPIPTHKRGFALMFQDGQLFAHLDVARNVAYALRLRRVPAVEARRRVAELLELVGLAGFGERFPATLSGGERQRVALARALAVNPRLLLLDEPLSALDLAMRERLVKDLGEILQHAQTTALLVTHDHEEAFALADRIAVMREGRVVQEGPIASVWQRPMDPETALFLGYARVLTGSAAAVVLAAVGLSGEASSGGVAVRRSALAVSPAGPLTGTVHSARATPDQVRLVVDVVGIGLIDAVAPLGSHVGPGDLTNFSVDAGRLAVMPSADPRQHP
jgi:thiamine transport system ATP-binding protein